MGVVLTLIIVAGVILVSNSDYLQGRFSKLRRSPRRASTENYQILPAYDEQKCYDSDEGQNHDVKGTVYGSTIDRLGNKTSANKVDICQNGKLIEYYCSSNNLIRSTSTACSEGTICENGACIPYSEGVIIFEYDFETEDDFADYKWESNNGFSLDYEDGNTIIEGSGFMYYPQDDDYFPMSITIGKYILTDFTEMNFRLKIVDDGGSMDFRRNIDHSTYSLIISKDHLSLNRSQPWGQSNKLAEAEIEPPLLAEWHGIKVKDNDGHIKIYVDGDLKIDHIDANTLSHGKVSWNTTSNDSLIYLDDIVILDTNPALTTEYDIDVDLSEDEGLLGRVHACATTFIEDYDTLAFSPDGPTAERLEEADIKYMRVRAIGNDGWNGGGVIVNKNPDGSLDLDFSDLDETVDTLKGLGKELYMRLGWEMPVDLASETCKEFYDYNWSQQAWQNSAYTTCPPENYAEWEELVYQIVKHYNIDRDDNIEYWVVWNEPDSEEYGGHPVYGLQNVGNYLQLYEASVNGALAADPSIKIGAPTIANGCSNGPVFGESCFWKEPGSSPHIGKQFLDGLLSFVKSKNLRLDFIAFHAYAAQPQFYDDMFSEYKELVQSYNLEQEPGLIMDEWARWKTPINEENAAWTAASIHYQMKEDIELSCITGFNGVKNEDPNPYYTEQFGFSMINGTVVKPTYFVFRMLKMLGNNKVEVEVNGDGEIADDDSIGAIATTTDDGIQIFVWRFDDLKDLEKSIDVTLKDISSKFPGTDKVQVNGYLIDETHSNSYYDYKIMGEDNNGGMYNLETGELDQVIDVQKSINGDEVSISTSLNNYSVLLLTVEPN